MRTIFPSCRFPSIRSALAAEIPVRDLNFDLKRLQAAHDDGSHGTRTARSYALAQIADTLHELGFKGPPGDRAQAQARRGAGARSGSVRDGPSGR